MEQTDLTSSREHPTTKTRHARTDGDSATSLQQKLLPHLSWIILAGIIFALGFTWLVSDGFRAEAEEMWRALSSGNQEMIRAYIRSFGVWAPVASVTLMVLQVVLAPIPASVVQLSNGVVFGIAGGAVLNLIGQMAGATIAFFISRTLGRGAAERLAGRIDEHGVVEHWLDRWGAKALLLVRMIPGMPSDFVSYLMGLTPMPARKYILFSFIGYIPQSIAYAWLGDYASDWFWWIVLGGFGVSGVIGLVLWAMRKFRRAPVQSALNIETSQDSC